MLFRSASHARQLLPRAWLQRGLGSVEQHVRYVDDQAACGLARLEHDIQLLAKPFTQRVLFLLGLLRLRARLLRLCIGLRLCRVCGLLGGFRSRPRLLGVGLRLQRVLSRPFDLDPLALGCGTCRCRLLRLQLRLPPLGFFSDGALAFGLRPVALDLRALTFGKRPILRLLL